MMRRWSYRAAWVHRPFPTIHTPSPDSLAFFMQKLERGSRSSAPRLVGFPPDTCWLFRITVNDTTFALPKGASGLIVKRFCCRVHRSRSLCFHHHGRVVVARPDHPERRIEANSSWSESRNSVRRSFTPSRRSVASGNTRYTT